jgi:hypothetical protein
MSRIRAPTPLSRDVEAPTPLSRDVEDVKREDDEDRNA